MKKLTTFLLAMPVMLAGCAYPSIGDRQADVPPQIVVRNDVQTWDNPGAFGPVPEELREVGAKICSSLDTDKVKHEARGYHAKAMNLEGQAFKGGGYYCVPKR